jgi:hypothetical protein
MSHKIVFRIERDFIGLRARFDPNRVEYDADGAFVRLTPLEETYAAKDLAEGYAARVFADPKTWQK